jgi:hypothetical protein
MNGQPTQWVAVHVVAQIYGVDVDWLRRAEQLGVVRAVAHRDSDWLLAVSELDRIATAVRWNRHFGVDLETVAVMVEFWR